MTAKASVSTNIIMWFTGILAASIIALWFISNNPFTYVATTDKIEEDLLQITQIVMHACNTLDYYAEYNPVTEEGVVVFSENEVCIEVIGKNTLKRCAPLLCRINSNASLELQYITDIVIQKNETVTVSQI